ncbi:iron-sulfur cluster carrier protein ApbC [Alteromonas pelagimontana]|uniref:Iron-sulfur cluster carrier protein n=1 Tax=Alteromonas pelagimontana TaxID=1858656 RepID=A0A6M4MGE3_9ALTE|nr:iron-sulfur cluster carrier protein ApbC [Alteromonas pelagimontana]QJR82261.1 iron-sulfur cluster carrier protein ApbC [Alteromonas pelagimontana]
MFFSRKPDKTVEHLAGLVAKYYSLPIEETRPWCRQDNDKLVVTLPFCAATQHQRLRQHIEDSLQAKEIHAAVEVTQQIPSAQTKLPGVTNIRNIVAIASGKGGVGKSTTSINLAFALQQEGARVGVLDADIYGPSIPIMLGNTSARPASVDGKHMQPIEVGGLVANSIGYLVPEEDAAVWRGPMASRALKQLIDETHWPVLDYLIVDMPPGTGDIQLTMAQQVPLSGAVIVTTPQDLALADAQKGIAMLNKVNVPVLGLIENMSYYQCRSCGAKEYVFSHGGGTKLAERYDLPLLGAMPLDMQIREHADSGAPLVSAEPDSPLAEAYREAARALSMTMSLTLSARTDETNIKGDPIGVRFQ